MNESDKRANEAGDRYPYTVAADYLRDFGGVDGVGGLRLNRSDASQMLEAIAKALGMPKVKLAIQLADYALANSEALAKAAADRLIEAIRRS